MKTPTYPTLVIDMDLGDNLIDLGVTRKEEPEEEPRGGSGDEGEGLDEATDEEPIEVSPAEERRPKKKRDWKKIGKVVGVVGIIVVATVAALFLPHIVLPADIQDVYIFINDNPEEELVHLIITVESTQFSRDYSGHYEVEVLYHRTVVYTLEGNMDGGDEFVDIEYEEFYQDNGDYEFRLLVKSYMDSEEQELTKTVHHIPISAFANEVTDQLHIVFDLFDDKLGSSLFDEGIYGSGTIEIFNGTEATSDQLLESYEFGVNDRRYFWGDSKIMDYKGGYEVIVDFSDFEPAAYTGQYHNYTVRIAYTNGMPAGPPYITAQESLVFALHIE